MPIIEEDLDVLLEGQKEQALLQSGDSMTVDMFLELFKELHAKMWRKRADHDLVSFMVSARYLCQSLFWGVCGATTSEARSLPGWIMTFIRPWNLRSISAIYFCGCISGYCFQSEAHEFQKWP